MGTFGQCISKFTGQERDAETGLDFFQARYMSSAQGRFSSADPLGNFVASTADPQSWNMYAYARNNPLTLIDPTGLCSTDSNYNFYDDDPDGTSFLYDGPCQTFQFDDTVDQQNSGQVVTYDPSDDGDSLDPGFTFYATGTANAGQPGAPGEEPNIFTCASEFGAKYSIAGGLQHFGIGTKGLGGFITNALGGNAFSGITDLVQSVRVGEAGGHNVLYNMGLGVAAGPTQGFAPVFGKGIEGTPWASGPVDVATTALVSRGFSAATGAGEVIQTLNGAARLGFLGLEAGEFATGFGEVKLAYDALSYFTGAIGCATGVVK